MSDLQGCLYTMIDAVNIHHGRKEGWGEGTRRWRRGEGRMLCVAVLLGISFIREEDGGKDAETQ